MQLAETREELHRGPSQLRLRLGAAACAVLASSLPAAVKAEESSITRFDGTGLLYGEKGRTNVVEPVVRVTRLDPSGQIASMQLALDAITGASPSGARPSGRIQTVTTPSGNVSTLPASEVPTSSFHDMRFALDGDWQRPLPGRITPGVGAHFSREKDYKSLGANGKLSLELPNRLTTVSAGYGVNHDTVLPVGGVPVGLSATGEMTGESSSPKRVTTTMLGVSQVMSRRWLLGVTASQALEHGYLTEPYKVVSLVDPSGYTAGQITEKRPDSRRRRDVLTSSVIHLSEDVLYLNHRYYWDDWGIHSNTLDVKYRHDLDDSSYVQPHVRLYSQTAANFYMLELPEQSGVPLALPQYASSDYRIGPLKTLTLGATYGFTLSDYPGQWFVRAEWVRQWGDNHPADAIGIQSQLDQFTPLDIGTLVVGYSRDF